MSDLDAAVAILQRGGLVAFPTETVYGLGADAASERALARLYEVKHRPRDHPVIVHIADAARLDTVAVDVAPAARRLAEECWPGPLTLIVARRDGAIHPAVTGGRPTVGVRVPDHPTAKALLGAFGRGVAAPSANRFGRVSPTTAAHVRADLGADVDLVLDGGACRVGVESTIVDCTDAAAPRVLRAGGIGLERIADIIGAEPVLCDSGQIAAPGTLPSHYAPDATVVLATADELTATLERHSNARVAILALAGVAIDVTGVTVLPQPHDVDEFARVLYARLRHADAMGVEFIVVVSPPAGGIGDAIRDRLRRAAGR